MSGDVQPRKRKDKKRRKDDGEQVPTQTHTPLSANTASDDVNIHVHKEGGTGGGICAKLVFFVLLSALAVVIGLIITEYRGLTDVDTVDSESRFAQIFEGWTDPGSEHHQEHGIEEILDEHDEDHEEDEGDIVSKEVEHEPSEEEDEDGNDSEVSEEKDEEDEESLEESDENQVDEEEDNAVQASDEDEEENEVESKEADEEDEDHEEDEQELENLVSEEDKDVDDGEPAEEDDSVEAKSEEQNEEDKKDDDDEDQEEEHVVAVDTKAAVPKKIKVKDVEKGVKKPKDDNSQESSGMAIKLGVGVFLLVVAHLVLVKKWKTATPAKPVKEEFNEPVPDLSRRNTIVVPPTFNEVEPDIEPEEEDYSDESLSEEEIREVKSAKTRYQELRSTYTRSLTPEGEIDYHKPPEDEDDYEENNEEEEDEEVSEDEEEDDEEGESENEDYDDDEDEELLKRLEAKYGKLREAQNKGAVDAAGASDKQSDDAGDYEYSNITSKGDAKIKSKIDDAQKEVQNNSAYAIKLFDQILQTYPSSPRSIYGKALALDYLADQRRSNEILEHALRFYVQLFYTENVPHALLEMAAEQCIRRMRFLGRYRNAVNVHHQLINRFPNNPKHLNDLAVTYLTINRVEDARYVLMEVLSKWPNDGFALVHFGFILKTTDGKLNEAVDYLKRGLRTNVQGVVNGRFYFHLGDALSRLGRNEEAMRVYETGVANNVFLSKYQRSLYNIPRLTARPWWNQNELPYPGLFRLLQQNWRQIRDEGLAALNEKGYFLNESENLRDTGEWKQFELFARGQKNVNNCRKCPLTCHIIENLPEARNCKRGQTKFSVMHPGTHVWPHCGPTNCRLRAHLGLKVPRNTFIRVAQEMRSWKEGEVFVFDDSFEHEVWHNGTDFRLVLIVDVWHPELTPLEKRNLSPI